MLVRLMNETLDGDYQTFKSRDGAYVREHFFGRYPETRDARQGLDRRGHLASQPRRPRSLQGLRGLQGGGRTHRAADGHPRQDDQGLRHGHGRRRHEHRAPAEENGRSSSCARSATASRFRSPTPSSNESRSSGRPKTAAEMKYLRERVAQLGSVPARRRNVEAPLEVPRLDGVRRAARRRPASARSRRRWRSCARSTSLMRDKTIGRASCRSSPTSRARSAWKGMFRQLGIYSSVGQLYRPQDADQLMWYREDKTRPDPAGRASTRPARCRRGSPPRRRTRRTACR